MRYPSLNRSNMRYRAPMESGKMNKLNADIHHDLSYLYARLDELKKETLEFKQGSQDGGLSMSSETTFIRMKARFLKGGDSRE